MTDVQLARSEKSKRSENSCNSSKVGSFAVHPVEGEGATHRLRGEGSLRKAGDRLSGSPNSYMTLDELLT